MPFFDSYKIRILIDSIEHTVSLTISVYMVKVTKSGYQLTQ